MASSYFLVFIALFWVVCFDNEAEAACGGLIEDTNGTITSPSYPNVYPANQTCTWEIKMSANYHVGLHFTHFNLEKHDSCDYFSVTLKSKMEDGSVREHGKFCGERTIPNIISESNTLLVEFKSDLLEESTGFEMEFFKVSDCKTLFEATSGVITSPLYPLAYPPNQTCTWEIRMPPNNLIKLVFKQFSLEGHEKCDYDSLTIRNVMKDREIGRSERRCGLEIPFNITSESNILRIEFKSDASTEQEGFRVEFYNVPYECGGLIEEREGVITSPFFPSLYLPDMYCAWNIQAPPNQNIKLKFIHFNVGSGACVSDYVSIRSITNDGKILEHGKFCGEDLPSVIYSESNILSIQFVSDSLTEYPGFKLEFSHVECGGLIEGGTGHISTPFFPDVYPRNKRCVWTIAVPTQHKLKLRFLDFEIEGGGEDCSGDFLLIQSKTAGGATFDYGKYCGVSEPSSIISKDSLILMFVSDRSYERKGFRAEYTIDKWTDYELSTSLMKSTPTTNQYENTEKENAFLTTNEGNIPSESVASVLAKNYSITENQQKEVGNSFLENEINKLSEALKLLTEKVASIEENQKILFNNCGDMRKIDRSKNSFPREGSKTSLDSSERQLLNDCGKYVFFLRRILGLQT